MKKKLITVAIILLLIVAMTVLTSCNQMLYDGTKKREVNPQVGRG